MNIGFNKSSFGIKPEFEITTRVYTMGKRIISTLALLLPLAFSVKGYSAANVSISATHSPANPGNNTAFEYYINVTNTGTANLTSVHIVETLPPEILVGSPQYPAGLTYYGGNLIGISSWSGAVNITPGEGFTITITGFTSPTIGKCISNTAWIYATTGIGDVEKISLDSGFCLPGTGAVSLAISKTHSPASPVPGGPVTYLITIENNGPTTVHSINVMDTKPDGITYTGHDEPAGFSYNTGGIPNWNAWWGYNITFLPGQVLTFTITGTTDLCYNGHISNTVQVDAWLPGCVYFQGPFDASARIAALDPGFDLTCPFPTSILLSQNHLPASPANGSLMQYAITLLNNGSTTITDLTITDTLPAGITWNSQIMWNSQDASFTGLTWNGSYGVASWTGPITLTPGHGVTIWIEGNIPACPTSGYYSNTVFMVATTSAGTSVSKSIDSGFSLSCGPAFGVSISKTHKLTAISAGNPATYYIVVANSGAATITSFKIVDTLPSLVTYASEDHAQAPGLAFALNGSIASWTGNQTLTPGQSFTITITGSTDACSFGTASNTAWVFAADSGSTSQAKSIDSGVFVLPLLFAYATSTSGPTMHSPASPLPGGPVTYSLVVTNTGAATITSFKIVDTLPSLVTYASEDHAQAPGLAFALNGSIASWTGNQTLAPGQSFTITLTGQMASCTQSFVSNTAWIFATTTCTSTQTNIIDSGFELLVPPTFTIAKTAITPFVAGEPASYRIVITNVGTLALTGLKISDTLATDLTFVSSYQPAALNPAVSGQLLSWDNTGSLAPGQSWTVTVNGTVALAAPGSIPFNSWCWATEGTCPQQRATTATKPITPAAFSASAVYTIEPPNPAPGDNFQYVITITNNGTIPITGIGIWDTLPANITYRGESHPAGVGFVVNGSNLGWWTTFPLLPGESISLWIYVTADPSATGTITNHAVVAIDDGASQQTSYLISGDIIVGASVVEGTVLIVGGPNGYIEPTHGYSAQIMVRPTAAGTISVNIQSMTGMDVLRMARSVAGHTTSVLTWDGKDKSGKPVPSGVYPVFINGPGIKYRSKMVLLR